MKAIVTGAAGFIGFHVARRLAREGFEVIAIDNLNDYYQVALKETRLLALGSLANIRFARANIARPEELRAAIAGDMDADVIVHLAAQAGVRYSVENPAAYVDANVQGQVTVFEQARIMPKQPPVVYASSSSVYGANTKVPFSESDPVNNPLSMRRRNARRSCWPTPMRMSTRSHRPACASSRSMAPMAGRIWRHGCSRTPFQRASRSKYTITARWRAISPSSMILSAACLVR